MMFVYMIRCESYLKIGVTNNLSRRLHSLAIGCPMPMFMEAAYAFDADYAAKDAEKELHKEMYKMGFYYRGEWFAVECLDRARELSESLNCKPVKDLPILNVRLQPYLKKIKRLLAINSEHRA